MAPLGDIDGWDQPNKSGDTGMYLAEKGENFWMLKDL
jgi:hypothetical protein